MKFVADLHIHSHYSRATSKDLDFEHLSHWAQLKGIGVVASGDIAHPGWLQEMKDKLEPAEEGLFQLKDEYAQVVQQGVPTACQAPVRFLLGGEISNIYKKYDRVRKVHNLLFMPHLAAVEKLQVALEKIGNIRSDGRPILGLDSRDLLEITLETDPQAYFIPAHIWTPWFSMLGSKSGFDSVEECFNDLTPHIFALETGLSSDPPMNWRVSALDGYTLVSSSDAHSPPKLAREANLFDTEMSYAALFAALKDAESDGFLGTIEFFPEEGKYHYDGHRKCGICWEPPTTLAHKNLCPVCGKPVTVGVMHRVETLADRPEGHRPSQARPFYNLTPLPEILGEVYQVGSSSKRVQQTYDLLLTKLGSELSILLELPLEEIEQVGGSLLAEGIRRVRTGELTIAAGYDGEYGVIKLFGEDERDSLAGQLSFFAATEPKKQKIGDRSGQPGLFDLPTKTEDDQITGPWLQTTLFDTPVVPEPAQLLETVASFEPPAFFAGLNPQQREAVLTTEAPLVIVAGPGTGKTRTLTYRIAYLILEQGVEPETILAITFTNKAAEEMAQRLLALLGEAVSKRITIKTFHAFGAMFLRAESATLGFDARFAIASEDDRRTLLKHSYPDFNEKALNQYLDEISTAKNQLLTPDSPELTAQSGYDQIFVDIYRTYEAALRQHHLLDFDDLILQTVRLFETSPDSLAKYQALFRWISIDEYQDINFAQYRLLRLLAAAETNLCAIGDPDQAIYGFRGADRSYFLRFEQDFPAAKILHLNQNYRSIQTILDASSQVIAQNTEVDRLKIWSEFIEETKLDIYQAPTDKAEAEYVVHQIERMVGGTSYFSLDSGRVDDDGAGRAFADFAVLYRLGAQADLLVEAFQRSGIPFQTGGQRPIYDYPEVKEILAYLWFLHDPTSLFWLERLLRVKKTQVRAAAVNRLLALVEAEELTGWQALQRYAEADDLSSSQKREWHGLVAFLSELMAETQPVARLVEQIRRFTDSSSAADKATAERIERLRRLAEPFADRLQDFLEMTVLQKETDLYDPRADRVVLMTLHAAKGLEFPVVFIVGCEETLLPYQREDRPFDLEEERRLFYVGMTRAQQKLILTHARTRFLFGQHRQNETSRFLNDIEHTLKEIQQMSARKRKEKPEAEQLKLF